MAVGAKRTVKGKRRILKALEKREKRKEKFRVWSTKIPGPADVHTPIDVDTAGLTQRSGFRVHNFRVYLLCFRSENRYVVREATILGY